MDEILDEETGGGSGAGRTANPLLAACGEKAPSLEEVEQAIEAGHSP